MKKNLLKYMPIALSLIFVGLIFSQCKYEPCPTPDNHIDPFPDATKELPLLDTTATDDAIRAYETAAGRRPEKLVVKYFGNDPIELYVNKSLPTITAVAYHVNFTENLTGIVAFSNEAYEDAHRTLALVKNAGFGEGEEKMIGGLLKAREWVGKGLRIRFAATEVEPSINARSFLIITPYHGKQPDSTHHNPDNTGVGSKDLAITFEMSSSEGSLNLVVDALDTDRDKVWVDLNNDDKKQANESISKFGEYVSYPHTASRINIYGNIRGFGCKGNHIKQLDVSRAKALTQLSCVKNELTQLDLSHNTELLTLTCYENQLTSLDLSHNVNIKKVECYDNPIASLDLFNNRELQVLQCYKMKLSNIDLKNNLKLSELDCSDNNLSALDLSKNNKLEFLLFSNNRISQIDLSQNSNLLQIYCENNGLSTLSLAQAPLLMTLYADGNNLTSLDFSGLSEIEDLHLWDNHISEADMRTLIASLPEKTETENGTLIVLDSQSQKEKNHFPSDLKSVCQAKHWKVYDHKGGSNNGLNDIE